MNDDKDRQWLTWKKDEIISYYNFYISFTYSELLISHDYRDTDSY